MRVDVLGISFDNVDMDEATGKALALANGETPSYIVTPNAEIVYETRRNTELFSIINAAALIVPDGAGVVLGAKMLGTPLKQKVAGVELAVRLAAELAKTGKSLFLLGAKPGIAELAAEKLCRKIPNLVISGTNDGYYKDENAVVEKIKKSGTDVLFVGMGSPRQEHFIAENLENTGAKLAIGIGGSFDIYAGVLKRAPNCMIKMNLEWLYRLLCEPSRIWRMLRLPKFIFAVIRYKKNR